jgi:PGF-CTERM protein
MKRVAVLVILFLLMSTASALRNPSAVYCEALGYEYTTFMTTYGEVGKCILPNGEAVDAWDFLRGKVALEYSYCAKEGYEAKHVEREDCKDCLVCVLPDGSEVEVTELMGLSFKETTCGDGVCGIPENYTSCPQDCPSGSFDEYCDGVSDGRCDPDCEPRADPDCKVPESAESTPATTLTAAKEGTPAKTPGFESVVAVVAVLLAAGLVRRKRG